MKRSLVLLLVVTVVGSERLTGQGAAAASRRESTRRSSSSNRANPYYATARAGAGTNDGKKMAQTPSDYINYEMEHGAFDMSALREFMRGLVDGGPTKSGHRTPAVIVTLPVLGLDEPSMRANYWVVQQVLAAGAHGVLLCHARSPEAARVMVEASRYPFAPKVAGLDQGLRGSGVRRLLRRSGGSPATSTGEGPIRGRSTKRARFCSVSRSKTRR